MNRHNKLFTIAFVFLALVMGFCVWAVTYAMLATESTRSSVMLIERQSIIYEEELVDNQDEIDTLKEENIELKEEMSELKKSLSFSPVMTGNYSLE